MRLVTQRLVGLSALALGWLSTVAHGQAPACEGLAVELDRVESALLEGRLDEPVATLDALYQSLNCGAPAPREELARLFLIEGAIHSLVGDPTASNVAFEAAHRTLPGFWNDDLGPQLRARYEAVATAPERDEDDGQIRLDPPSFTMVTLLDGERVPFPINARAGLHVVQVAPMGDEVVFGRVVRLLPGQALTLSTGIIERPTTTGVTVTPVEVPVVRLQPKRQHWLVVGASAGGAALVSAGIWHSQTAAMRRAETLDALDAARARQTGLGVASWALGALSAAGLTVHVVR